MDTIFARCAGLDVHKETVASCVRRMGADGVKQEVRIFGTMTGDLLALADWLSGHGVTHVAMESTGVYWKPVYNILEAAGFQVLLVNARHLKKVPGRKTDIKDCQWIAQLLQAGLLRGSFVPPRALRELRDLTRHRAQLVAEATRVANRLQKTLEDANVKLSSVASDILGVSGRRMLESLASGVDDPDVLAALARGRLRAKLPQLRRALEGTLSPHHRFMLRLLLNHLDKLNALIEELAARIEEQMGPFEEEISRLDQIPGVNRQTAENILAEIGTDMSHFPSDDQLCSWAGICPGNQQSAGKRKSGKTPKGDRWLRRTLTQAAWAASRTKASYFSAQYRRLAKHRGKKRAVLAVAHAILRTVYHMLKNHTPYTDLGPDYFDRLHPDRLTHYLVKRLQSLGHTVILQPPP